MDSKIALVTSVEHLLEATRGERVEQIIVHGAISHVPSLRLSPGQRLVGEKDGAALIFRPEIDGLQITTDNEVRDLRLQVSQQRRALFTDTSVQTLGRLLLGHLSIVGSGANPAPGAASRRSHLRQRTGYSRGGCHRRS